MALDQGALLDVLEALKAADVGDRVRGAVEIYQALIETEVTATIGAAPHERSDTRTAQRNGHRVRTLSTTAGDLELRIPKLRTGSFFPSLLERRRRANQALFAVVMEAYLHGVSTRKVDDLVKALGADTGISKSEVSRICADLDIEVAAFRDRCLAEPHFPYDVVVLPLQLVPDLPGSVDTAICLVHHLDRLQQLLVARSAGRGGTSPVGVDRRGCDLCRRLRERLQDRLDTVLLRLGVDELDLHRDGRFNSAAKKDAADFKI